MPWRFVRSIALCFAVAALLCVGPLASSRAQAQKVWRHAVIEPKSDAGFVLMFARRGFAERQGLKVEILEVKTETTGLKALLAGELDSYEGSPASAIVAASRGADLRILGCAWPQLVHGIFVKDEISSVQDLKGKTMGISSPGAMPDVFVRAVLEQNKIPASEIKFANLGSDTDRSKALAAGVIDAAVVSTEFIPIAPKSIKLLFAARDVLPNFVRVCVTTTAKNLSERRDDATRFIAAEITALRHAVSHRDETLQLTREITKAKPDDPRPGFIFDEVVRHKDIDPEMPIPMDKFEWMQAQVIRTGNARQAIDLSTIVDATVREKALQLIGK